MRRYFERALLKEFSRIELFFVSANSLICTNCLNSEQFSCRSRNWLIKQSLAYEYTSNSKDKYP